MLAALESARDAERRFLADASHELRTPLTALRGNAAYVARHGADRDALEGIERDAERLTGLLDDLLALAREDAAPAVEEPVLLDELARAAADAEPQVVVDAPQPVAVTGDGAALARALANLVENARIHGPPAGRITVAARLEGDRAVLSVADEGEGIPPADVEHAFARFWRSPDARARPGSGLGLAIVKATAARHGGAVRVDGARVSLVLPAAPAPLRRSSGNAPITRT
jgi:two-component system OmpR family sensor kinase